VQVPVHNLAGKVVKHIDVSDQVFAVPLNPAVVHQALVRQKANARQGSANTKMRGEVSGSTRKLHRQKHTGFARAGSRKSPLRRGGGVTFGPKPRSYRQALPKKMRRLAIRCALSAKARDGELRVLEELVLENPKTKEIAQTLATFGAESSALIALSDKEKNVVRPTHNLSRIKAIPANLLNVADMFSHKMLLMSEPAVRTVEQLWGKEES
jgi:large subunit ribosomal protein L4